MLLRARLGGVISWWRQNAKIAVVAAVAGLVCMAAVYVIQELRLREQRIAANDHEVRMRAVLTAPDAALKTAALRDGGTLAIISSLQRDSAIVVVREAKPTGVQRAYQIWLLEGSNSKPVGLLAPDQVSATLVISGLRGANTVGVTVERAEGERSPTLPLVAEIPLAR